jgi:predicted acyltransferase
MIAVCIAFYVIGKMPAVEHSTWMHWISAQRGNAAHTSIVLCGAVVSLLFFERTKDTPGRIRFFHVLIFTVLLFVAGYFLRPGFKISKIYATPTWCLYSAAFCTLLFAFLYYLIDRKKIHGWTSFFKPAACNSLLTYIIPDIIYYLAALTGIVLVPQIFRSGWPGIVWSAFFAVAVMGIVILLNKMKLKLQL